MSRHVRLVGGPKDGALVPLPDSYRLPSTIVFQGFFSEFFADNRFHVCDYVQTGLRQYTYGEGQTI